LRHGDADEHQFQRQRQPFDVRDGIALGHGDPAGQREPKSEPEQHGLDQGRRRPAGPGSAEFAGLVGVHACSGTEVAAAAHTDAERVDVAVLVRGFLGLAERRVDVDLRRGPTAARGGRSGDERGLRPHADRYYCSYCSRPDHRHADAGRKLPAAVRDQAEQRHVRRRHRGS
jgi:hypothetical protein